MIKLLIRLILSLSILLSSGYGQLYAHKHQESILPSLLKAAQADTGRIIEQDQSAIIHLSSNHTEKGFKFNALDIEEENNETTASKKVLDSSKIITVLFNALSSDFFFQNLTKASRFCEQFSHISSCRWHLIIQVFRI